MKLNCPNNVDIVKDLCDENVAPSSVKCTFKRGTCLVHKLKGEKYTDVAKKWMNRGGGKGYGWITTRTVKYRCKANRNLMASSTLTDDGVGGQGLVEK